MNQIYNLAQTIAEDKETIAKLEKHLLNAKNILAAHENAMARLTTIPSVIVSDKCISAARGAVREDKTVLRPEANYVRITMDNYLDLGIEVEDKVDIVVSGDKDFKDGTTTTVVEFDDCEGISTFLRLTPDKHMEEVWYCYDSNSSGEGAVDELYLIRTPEGSLNKQ